MPPKKATRAKSKSSKKTKAEESEEEQEEEEEEKPTKRTTRQSSSAKKQPAKKGKKNKDEDEEEDEEEEKEERKTNKKTTQKGSAKKQPAKKGKKANDEEDEEEDEEEDKKPKRTIKQSPAKKQSSKKGKKSKDEDDEEEDEEEEKKPTPKRNTRSTRSQSAKDTTPEPKSQAPSATNTDSKAATKASAKKAAKAKAAASESEESADDKNAPAKASSPKAIPVKKAPAKKRAKKKDSGWSPYSGSGRSYGYGYGYGYYGNRYQYNRNDDDSDVSDKPKRGGGRKKIKMPEEEIDLEAKVELDPEITLKDVRVLALKGKAPYDYYVEEEDPNNPDIKKFFHMQILDSYKSTFPTHYFTFYRWGKDGEVGEWSLRGFFDRKRAIKIYEEKIEERKKYRKWKDFNAAKKENSASQDQTTSQNAENQELPGLTVPQNADQSQDNSANPTKGEEKMEEEKKDEKGEDMTQAEVKSGMEEEKPAAGQAETKNGMEEEKKEQEEKEEKVESKEHAKPVTSKLDLNKIECTVDKCCVLRDETEVLIKDDEIFDMKYNTSDIERNSNHFYTFQVIRHLTDKNKHYIFSRYGRVGLIGEWVLRGVYNEEQAIETYRAKQKEKKDTNKYKALEMSYTKDDPEILTKAFQESAGKSKLDKKVSEFIQLIFDFKMMDTQMVQAGYDPKKLPLGKLSLNMINEGFAKLKEISEALKNHADESTLKKLCSEFYTVIPQNIGWKNMSTMVIRDNKTITEKLEFLESLRQIQIAYQMVHGLTESSEMTNPIDANYEKLKCDIEPVDTNSEEYKKISEYINNTKESFEVEILEMFKINKHGSNETFKKDLNNHLMLWHGSRLTNFVGILSQGLRIAPPEAPVSGYRLGKGIYLADMISKSIPYCYASGSNGIFCIMVCDSSLGNFNEKLNDDFYASNLPTGKHSTKALGRVAPPLNSYKEFEQGVMIPSGKPEKTEHDRSAFAHNEYIVYDVNQVQIRYLLKMKQKSRGLFY